MNTLIKQTEASDAVCLAYGEKVKELLSMSSAKSWSADLWTMYTSCVFSQKEMGVDVENARTFSTFKALLGFFENLDELEGVK